MQLRRRCGFELLEDRALLNAAPISRDDSYTLWQDGELRVNTPTLVPGPADYPGIRTVATIPIPEIFSFQKFRYSAPYDLIFTLGGGKVNIYDGSTGTLIDFRRANFDFQDIDITGDGRFLYATDHQKVHRYDAERHLWEERDLPFNIQFMAAVDARRFVSRSYTYELVLFEFGSEGATSATVLERRTTSQSTYLEYDHATRTLMTGRENEFTMYKIDKDRFVDFLPSFGTEPPFFGPQPVVLTPDGDYFYFYGVQTSFEFFPSATARFESLIVAAGHGIAFTNSEYFNAATRELLGPTSAVGTVIGNQSQDDSYLWAYKDSNLVKLKLPWFGKGLLGNDSDSDYDRLTTSLVVAPQHGTVSLTVDGNFLYIPSPGYTGVDRFQYQVSDGHSFSEPSTVTLTIVPPKPNNIAVPRSDTYAVSVGGVLNVGAADFSGLTTVAEVPQERFFATAGFSSHFNLLFGKVGGRIVSVLDVATGREVSRFHSLGAFSDFDMSPNGRFFYIGDLNIGQYYVHQFDCQTGAWQTKAIGRQPIQLECVSEYLFVLSEGRRLFLFDYGQSLSTPINEQSSADYISFSDVLIFSPLTARVYSGSSHGGMVMTRIVNNQFEYLSPSPHSAELWTTLSTDGQYLYSGRRKFLASNIETPLATVADHTLAATAGVRFAGGLYYSEESDEILGMLDYDSYVWAFDDRRFIWQPTGRPALRQLRINSGFFGVLHNDEDADNDGLRSILDSPPVHGSVELSQNGTFVYRPSPGYEGLDTFTYVVDDGYSTSGPATVTIEVGNDAPVVAPDAYSIDEDTTLAVGLPGVLANDFDPEGRAFTARLASRPSHGTLTFESNGSFRYVPEPNYAGPDSFTYTANDELSRSRPATVTIEVRTVPDAPLALPEEYQVRERAKLEVGSPGVMGNDIDPDGQTIRVVLGRSTAHGTLVLNSLGSFSYTPNATFHGTDSFTYRATDGQDQSEETLVTIVVEDIPDRPIPGRDTYSGDEDTLLVIPAPGLLANDTDLDGDTLRIASLSVSNGVATWQPDGSFTFRPDPNYFGTFSFSYEVTDGKLTSQGTGQITLAGMPDAPITAADTITLLEDTKFSSFFSILNNDRDPDGDPMTAELVALPTNGVLTFQPNGLFVYQPNPNFNGIDQFTYSATDGVNSSLPTTVTLRVNPANDLPIAINDEFVLGSGLTVPASLGVLQNDIDVDGDRLSARLMTGPRFGTLDFRFDGSFTYTPGFNFTGFDSFQYRARDARGESQSATATLTLGVVARTETVSIVSRRNAPMEGSVDIYLDVPASISSVATAFEVLLPAFPAGSGLRWVSAEHSSFAHPPLFFAPDPTFAVVNGALQVALQNGGGGAFLRNGAGLFAARFVADAGVVGSFPVQFDPQFTTIVDANGNRAPFGALRPGSVDLLLGTSPTVRAVALGSSDWTAPFISHLSGSSGLSGYEVPKSSEQLASLPWSNLNTVHVKFSEAVVVERSHLAVAGVRVPHYTIGGFTYDSSTYVATWTLSEPLPSDKLLIQLPGDGVNSIRDLDGYALDGEWTTGGNAPQSGNGTMGGNFQFRVNVQPGDSDRSGHTNIVDTIKTRNKQFTQIGDLNYSPFYDVNGSGGISIQDTVLARNNQFTSLPGGEPAVIDAGSFSAAPLAAGPLQSLPLEPPPTPASPTNRTDSRQDGSAIDTPSHSFADRALGNAAAAWPQKTRPFPLRTMFPNLDPSIVAAVFANWTKDGDAFTPTRRLKK